MYRPDIQEAIQESRLSSDTADAYGIQSPNHIAPGALWLDDQGYHINAHGAGILIHDGFWYWFGEHKSPVGDEARVGVHVYRSRDGINWQDGGIALCVSDDPLADSRSGCIIERPKVIYCAKTKQFVMYAHLERIGEKRYSGMALVATADQPCGPFMFATVTARMLGFGREMCARISKFPSPIVRRYGTSNSRMSIRSRGSIIYWDVISRRWPSGKGYDPLR